MENGNHTNMYKFGLYQGDETVIESIFSADIFNPVVRYSVDIRNDIDSIIKRFQDVLSKKRLTTDIDFGDTTYRLLDYYRNNVRLDPYAGEDKLIKPKQVRQKVNGEFQYAQQFRFGLYINKHPIVERDFPVNNYNPAVRFSLELGGLLEEIIEELNDKLKSLDVAHMWEDHDLLERYQLIHINQIRELKGNLRSEMLEKIDDVNYVKQTRKRFR